MEQGQRIIEASRSVIVAADVYELKDLMTLLRATADISGISAFKPGITLGLDGLLEATRMIKLESDGRLKVIYDHQKAGNDIPEMGEKFAKKLVDAGVDAAILFPFTGPATQEAWTNACFSAGLQVLTGGIMTHPKFLVSEGGYIADEAPEAIFRLAAKLGVRHFVVPGNKLGWVQKLRAILVEELGEGNFVLYAPGFITQGGDLSECGLVAGKEFHGIVGSGIYNKDTVDAMRVAALRCTSQLIAA